MNYQKTYNNTPVFIQEHQFSQLEALPILEKDTIKQRVNEFCTITTAEGSISKIGGVTVKSLEVIFTKYDVQDCFVVLDDFRERFGFQLKKKDWFSGKAMLIPKDVINNRFWKINYMHKVRYYSTFYLKDGFQSMNMEDVYYSLNKSK
jgi:phenylacetate-CoA ligase